VFILAKPDIKAGRGFPGCAVFEDEGAAAGRGGVAKQLRRKTDRLKGCEGCRPDREKPKS